MMVSQQQIGETSKGMYFVLARSTNGDSYLLWVKRFFCSVAHRLRMGERILRLGGNERQVPAGFQ
jgi:hypothetical protein